MGKHKMVWMVVLLLGFLLYGCNTTRYSRFEDDFFGYFDTRIHLIGYNKNQEDFDLLKTEVRERIAQLDQLFDIYHDYEGIANIKTINDAAGKNPVKVDKEIIDMLLFSKDMYQATDGKVNVALGSVLSIWHDYREKGSDNPALAEIPPMEQLQAAREHTNIDDVIIDQKEMTVFLAKEGMRLDVGAIAKGYTANVVAKESKEKGSDSFILDMGGNVMAIGKPMEKNRIHWGVGIQDPTADTEAPTILDTVFINDRACVTSGDYQRYYVVNGKRLNHIIDPETLFPASNFLSVSVFHEDSGIADAMSTALFILHYEEGAALADKYQMPVIWVLPDKSIKTNQRYDEISKTFGGATANK